MFKSILSIPLFTLVAVAQNAAIAHPPQGTSVSPGSSLIVQIERPNTLSGSEEVAVVVGIQSCATRACISPADFMGSILYNGQFSPQDYSPEIPPYQNFTVQVPSGFANGTALIGVAHLTLIGAGLYPWLEVLNRTITIA
ncbi:hypothetical protein BJ138DRAFT_1101582 [Hygrophoropsis aurantiaca]|uniref:Uncharacterized protein n=1 Tax=Hygrophoropsis aurantiaca TaxID=72124 RepID=A0ACB8ABQ2_9AGAM|nr:hypothetical protein BJ138DRAFT_1101582 [Hygrophoropsis aurantiaca]